MRFSLLFTMYGILSKKVICNSRIVSQTTRMATHTQPADSESYELQTSIGGFSEGAVLDITGRFGSWHPADVKLEGQRSTTGQSLELTAEQLTKVARPVEQSPKSNAPIRLHTRVAPSTFTEATQSEVDAAIEALEMD